MQTEGEHVVADMWFDGPLRDGWAHIIQHALTGVGKMRVLQCLHHKFEPQGETYLWLLAESHCSAHTFPEHSYLSLDVYGCGDGKPVLAAYKAMDMLQPVHHQIQVIPRGADERAKADAA